MGAAQTKRKKSTKPLKTTSGRKRKSEDKDE